MHILRIMQSNTVPNLAIFFLKYPVVYFAAELLVHFVSEWQSFRNRLKDLQLIIRLLELYTKVVYFAAELLVYFGAE